jgi:manganese transport system ATP-binding protein
MGSNGSGKSTLMNAIAGLVEPVRGEMTVLGKPPPPGPGSVAYVLQATSADALLPVTVREIVTMARFAHHGLLGRLRGADRAAIDSALATMELESVAHRRFSELSGGQRQRALVAQGLAQEAEVLLLDEPMTGLDLVSRQRIIEVLRSEREAGRAVVMASHDLDDATLADHVLLLAGRVVAEGPPERALAPEPLREAYGHRYLELDTAGGIVDDHHHHGHDHSHDRAVEITRD